MWCSTNLIIIIIIIIIVSALLVNNLVVFAWWLSVMAVGSGCYELRRLKEARFLRVCHLLSFVYLLTVMNVNFMVAQKGSHYQVIKKLYLILIKPVREIRFICRIKQ